MLKTWDFGSSVKRVEFAPVESGVGGDGNGGLQVISFFFSLLYSLLMLSVMI